MTLENADIRALLPYFMRADSTSISLAASCSVLAQLLAKTVQLLSIWDKINELPEAMLDELAWELDIDWYDYSASSETKRQLIRDSDLIHSRRGTKWAVVQLINTYFGDALLAEWFEYGGEPYHFQVYSSDPLTSPEAARKFRAALESVKNVRSWLDGIFVIRTWGDVLNRDYPTWQEVLDNGGTWGTVLGHL